YWLFSCSSSIHSLSLFSSLTAFFFFFFFFFYCSRAHRDLHSFPTRRSSDLGSTCLFRTGRAGSCRSPRPPSEPCPRRAAARGRIDRKSTRLNSSHVSISYAVFCLKKKKKKK